MRAGLMHDGGGSRRACVRHGGCAGCGGWAVQLPQPARSNAGHLVNIECHLLWGLASTTFKRKSTATATQDVNLGTHVRCRTTPASRTQGRSSGTVISARQARRKESPFKAVRLSTAGQLTNGSATAGAHHRHMETVTDVTK
jgi:hypothetical protein